MKNENTADIFSQFSSEIIIRNESNTKDLHYEKAINAKLAGQNPLLPFESCIIDHSGKQFTCIHEHCSDGNGCFKNGELEDNIGFHELTYHPDDRTLWCKEIFPDIIHHINSQPTKDTSDFRFIFNHRYIRRDESVSQFMHEGTLYFAADQKLPYLKLNVFAEIGDFKADESIILTIFSYQDQLGYQKVFRKVYGGSCPGMLTNREMEIIRLCHEGQSSKIIADKLNLSIHTVKNHKRNCMEKTSTHAITELIHLCLTKGWL